MEGDDGALVDVHGDARVVERLLRVPQLVPQVGDAALEDGAVVPGNQGPVYACKPCFEGVKQSYGCRAADSQDVFGQNQLYKCTHSISLVRPRDRR